jgi:hypothetical protein
MSISLAWLIPNHYPPWQSFHSDLVAGVVLAGLGAWLFFPRKTCGSVLIPWIALFAMAAACIPLLQWCFGHIYFFGVAWTNALYLFGLALAIMLGAHWEEQAANQGADFLFSALILAAIASTGMQWYQWLGFDALDLAINRGTDRPAANLGQPNQQASLLLLGMVGTAWSSFRERVRPAVAVLLICFLLTGLALTFSRTAWLNLSILLAALFAVGWHRRSLLTMWAAWGLGVFFVFCYTALPSMARLLSVDAGPELKNRLLTGQRPDAWAMFVEAAAQQPWAGYGWGQAGFAHLKLADSKPFFGVVFEHGHNILIDLVVWNGFPLGLALIFFCAYWCVNAARFVREEGDLVLALGLVVLGVHAMLEYPLHYAYFLLPFGLVVGILSSRLCLRGAVRMSNAAAFAPWIIAGAAIIVTLYDYARVETSFSDLRFEKARIHTDTPGRPPEVWVLTHLRDLIILGRWEPLQKMDDDQLEWMRILTNLYPSPLNAYSFATALAFNERNEEAQLWLKKMCRAFPQQVCDSARVNWMRQSKASAALAATAWPDGY